MPSVGRRKPPFTTPATAAATAPRRARGSSLATPDGRRSAGQNRRIRYRRARPETPRQPRTGQHVDAETAPHQVPPGRGVPRCGRSSAPGARPVMSAGAAATPAGPDLDDGQWMYLSAAAAGQGRTVADSAPAPARQRAAMLAGPISASEPTPVAGSNRTRARHAAGPGAAGTGFAAVRRAAAAPSFGHDGFGSAQQGLNMHRRASRPSTPRRSILAECASTGGLDRRWRRPRASSTRRRPVINRARRARRARTGRADRSVRADAGRGFDRTTGPPCRPPREHAVTQDQMDPPGAASEPPAAPAYRASNSGRRGPVRPQTSGEARRDRRRSTRATGGCRTYRQSRSTGSADLRAPAARHAGRSRRGGVTAPGSRAPGRRPSGCRPAGRGRRPGLPA